MSMPTSLGINTMFILGAAPKVIGGISAIAASCITCLQVLNG